MRACGEKTVVRSLGNAEAERGKPLLRALRGGRGAFMRLRAGFMEDPAPAAGGRNRFPPFPDAEFAEARRPPPPRPGNSPRAPNAPAAPAEAWGAERAGGRSAAKWIEWRAGGGLPDAHAHAGHA